MHASDIVFALKEASDGPHALQNVRRVLNDWRGRIDEVSEALDYISGIGGNANQAFYRTPELSVLKVCFPSGKRTPPHDHGSWAAILVLSGSEKNVIYRQGGDGLEYANEAVLTPGTILTMPADAAHTVESLGDEPAIGLHVYMAATCWASSAACGTRIRSKSIRWNGTTTKFWRGGRPRPTRRRSPDTRRPRLSIFRFRRRRRSHIHG